MPAVLDEPATAPVPAPAPYHHLKAKKHHAPVYYGKQKYAPYHAGGHHGYGHHGHHGHHGHLGHLGHHGHNGYGKAYGKAYASPKAYAGYAAKGYGGYGYGHIDEYGQPKHGYGYQDGKHFCKAVKGIR